MKFHFGRTLGIVVALGCSMWGMAQSSALGAPLRLTLDDALQRGLQSNLNMLVARTRIEEAQGALARRSSAALLPRANAQAYSSLQNRNLRAFGIASPGLPEMVGPFSNYYVGVSVQQSLLDLAALRAMKANEAAVEVVRSEEEDVRGLIVRAVAASYLNAQTCAARAVAAQSRVNDATAMATLAIDRHDAGVATGVDVLRAQVQLANEQQTLLVARNQYQQALLVLERNIGLNSGMAIELAEPLKYEAQNAESSDTLISQALASRADYAALAKQRESVELQMSANRARYYPKISVSGNFGGLGRSVGGFRAVGSLQGQVDFSLFDRDRAGESDELISRLRRVEAQIDDRRRGIAEEVRAALLDLDSATAQVAVSQQGEQLARRELELARDRFEAGATNNIEVITAQDSLARAQENAIIAVSRHVDAKYALARATGRAKR